MPSVLSESGRAIDTPLRSLLLIWQDPTTRMFRRIGRFSRLSSGSYAFSYEAGASQLDGFYGVAEFPDFQRIYISESLPAFLANRVMSADRINYNQYRDWLGLSDGADTPLEILARTGGSRATDTYHLVDAPLAGDRFESRFFVSGIRHVDGANERISRVHVGDTLEIRPQPDNPVNSKALLIDVSTNEEIGWVPDWLLDEVHEQFGASRELRVSVERINTDAPDHLKVLALIESA